MEYSVRNFYLEDYLHAKAVNIEILRILLKEIKYHEPIKIKLMYVYIIIDTHVCAD